MDSKHKISFFFIQVSKQKDGTYEGLPEGWAEKLNAMVNIHSISTHITKLVTIQYRTFELERINYHPIIMKIISQRLKHARTTWLLDLVNLA